MVNYSELPGLDGVDLEDSFVMAIEEAADILVFELDAVLTPRHHSYEPPPADEQHCYRRGRHAVSDRQSQLAGSIAGLVP